MNTTQELEKLKIENALLTKLLLEQQRPHCPEKPRVLFVTYYWQWLQVKKDELQPSTYFEYHRIYANYVFPYFQPKEKLLCEITPTDIKAYYRHLKSSRGMANNSLIRHHANLYTMFKCAYVEGDIPEMVMDKVQRPKLQAVNSNGDRSPLVTKAVATKGTLKIAIDEPSWTSSDKARVRVTVSDSSRITEVMARTSEDNEWVDITDSRYIFITADTTVYASVENEKGELRKTSKEITCFDKVAPKVTATQDGNVVNIRATDDKSGVKSILVNNKVYSEQAIFNGKLAYRIPDGTSQITVYAEDAAGNLSSAVDLPLQVTVTAMPVIVSPEPETSSQPPQEVSLPEPESREEEAAEPTPEAPPVETEPVTPQTSPVAQATAAVGGIGTTAAGGIWYWLRKIRLNKPVEELELDGKKLLYDESEFGGAIDPDDSQGGN